MCVVCGVSQICTCVRVCACVRAQGAGNCVSPASYTHGKDATLGQGAYRLELSNDEAPGELRVALSGEEAFKGVW